VKRKLYFVILMLALAMLVVQPVSAGVNTANGWYEGEEIYYIDLGIEEGEPALPDRW